MLLKLRYTRTCIKLKLRVSQCSAIRQTNGANSVIQLDILLPVLFYKRVLINNLAITLIAAGCISSSISIRILKRPLCFFDGTVLL